MERLPEAIIQHIQSFLRAQTAAETSIICKSWYSAWLTRPNLEFCDLDHFVYSDFVRYMRRSMQRYRELQRRIESFKVLMDCSELDALALANEMTKIASTELGATEVDVELMGCGGLFSVDELLASTTLERLSLFRCRIHPPKVSFIKLRSLNLRNTCIEGDINVWELILKCPSIEEFTLSECYDHPNPYLRKMLAFTRPAIFCDHDHKLRVLVLEKVEIGDWFFPHISSSFPSLQELTFRLCLGYQHVQISCTSLEFLSIDEPRSMQTKIYKFDVPRIRKFKFKFSGNYIPCLSFGTTSFVSRDWESDISLVCSFEFSKQKSSSWFYDLRELLLGLGSFKISLYLHMYISSVISDCKRICLENGHKDISSLSPVVVEKLRLKMYVESQFRCDILKNLFWCFRPNLMTLYWLPPLRYSFPLHPHENNDFTTLLYDTLMENRMPLHDLKHVNVGFFQKDTPMPWKTLLDASANSRGIQMQVCLQLTWTPTA